MKTNHILAAAVALLVSVSASAQTVDEIVDKHIAAMGGADKLKGVTSLITERSLSVQGMEIPTITTVVVGKSMRSESTIMGNSMIQVVDGSGSTGWMIKPAMMQGTGEPEDMPADQLKQQVGQLDPFGPLMNYKDKGNKVELVGKEKVDGKDAYHLKVTTKEGNAIDEYLDATTYLLSKIKTSMGGQDGEIAFSDYKDVDGIKFANTMEIANPQMGTLTMTTNKTRINPQIDASIFKKPAK
ncbi:outer membrane lipoprotein-sorting protein [Fibrella sp. HMF5335]|uniref:Outer membrane lipoprotein-sorting protein n=1 Tax=Fibrella rubiginis TaxID=2817060 RepID=A0A939GEP5_9BACT|nr:outer membrane lipoprotein-sorting protein [Fibrella rubiginis]MBO0937609.1 outer membrane lipoprotein-sorting protein [Fibrella rubiginis]